MSIFDFRRTGDWSELGGYDPCALDRDCVSPHGHTGRCELRVEGEHYWRRADGTLELATSTIRSKRAKRLQRKMEEAVF